MTAIFANPPRHIVANGSKTLHLFCSAMTPARPLVVRPVIVVVPGYVSARTAGKTVCMPKYIGNSPVWRVANWGRGRTLKATMPPMKDWSCQCLVFDEP